MLTGMSSFYALLNAADLLMTLLLMSHCKTNIEGNPIASTAYSLGGPVGMAIFKILITAFVIGVAFYIHNKKKPWHSFFLIGTGCTIMAFTIGYSLHLILIGVLVL